MFQAFERSPFFYRYLNVQSRGSVAPARKVQEVPEWLELYHGDCVAALCQIDGGSVDGAVTSPPYYNAREYATWPNLYAYLYDMKAAAEGVFRVLRPGAYYLFNIFDYFDNDNIVAYSELGKRRLALSSYMVQVFRKCGFQIAGNVVWYKGEVEGKRNYNQGNRGPFFQLPLNAWEHVLVLRKPGNDVPAMSFPGAIYRRPVVKWVRGKNRHGHSAPFPAALPRLICSRLCGGAKIVDPFAGSLTTAIVARRFGLRAIAIEIHREYLDRGLAHLADLENRFSFMEGV